MNENIIEIDRYGTSHTFPRAFLGGDFERARVVENDPDVGEWSLFLDTAEGHTVRLTIPPALLIDVAAQVSRACHLTER